MRFSQKKIHLFVFLSSHLPTLRAVDRKPEAPPSSPQLKWRGRQWVPAIAEL